MLKDYRNAIMKVLKIPLQGLNDNGSSSKTPAKCKNYYQEKSIKII